MGNVWLLFITYILFLLNLGGLYDVQIMVLVHHFANEIRYNVSQFFNI
jgi:hypothetical protein